MVVQLRKKQSNVLPYRIALWSVVAMIAVAVNLQNNPMTLDVDLELSEGQELTRTADADILVVLDYEAIRQSEDTFSGRDFSAAWIDVFEQEIGPLSIATPETLSAGLLDDSRIIVLTHSVTRDTPDTILERVRRQVLDGHTLIIERPRDRARELFSADGQAGVRQGQAITHAEGLAPRFMSELEYMPLFTEYIGSTSPREGATTLLAIDGAPVIYVAEFGDGQVITVDFDLGRQLVALQQGRPTEDFRVPRRPAPDGTPTTSDLIADDSLLGTTVPYADLLKRYIVYGVLMPYAAPPGFWNYRNGADGAVAFAHEDSRLGDGGAWKLDYENQQGGSSTLLTSIDSGLTKEGAEAIQSKGGHIGLAWRPPDPSTALYENVGFLGYEAFRRPVDLGDQIDELQSKLTIGSVRTSRSLSGTWTSNWSEPLAALAAGGIRTDLSYDALTHRGFAFGTGLPFHTVTDEGMPLGLREYPITVPADATEGPSVEELLAASSDGHHQLLTIASRPSQFADYPDMERFEQWLALFTAVQRHNHWMTNISGFETYQRSRRRSSIRSRLDRNAHLPESLQSPATAPEHRGKLLRVTAEVDDRGMFLVIPEQIGETSFLDALEGTERVGADIVTNRLDTEEASMTGFGLRRVRLERGFNNLEFYYH